MAAKKKAEVVAVRALCDANHPEFGHAGCIREGGVSVMSAEDAEAAVATGDFEYLDASKE